MSRDTRQRPRTTYQATRAPTIGLIVEGHAEFLALPVLARKIEGCPPLKAINLRGVGSASPEGIAKMSIDHVIQHQLANRSKVVLCIDLEERNECPGAFAQAILAALHRALQQRGKSHSDVHVVIADRAFEAWILADARGLFQRGVFKHRPTFHSFEGGLGAGGKKGKSELGHLLDNDYRETHHGPHLFEQLDFDVARRHGSHAHGSRSLDKLLRVLGV